MPFCWFWHEAAHLSSRMHANVHDIYRGRIMDRPSAATCKNKRHSPFGVSGTTRDCAAIRMFGCAVCTGIDQSESLSDVQMLEPYFF